MIGLAVALGVATLILGLAAWHYRSRLGSSEARRAAESKAVADLTVLVDRACEALMSHQVSHRRRVRNEIRAELERTR